MGTLLVAGVGHVEERTGDVAVVDRQQPHVVEDEDGRGGVCSSVLSGFVVLVSGLWRGRGESPVHVRGARMTYPMPEWSDGISLRLHAGELGVEDAEVTP